MHSTRCIFDKRVGSDSVPADCLNRNLRTHQGLGSPRRERDRQAKRVGLGGRSSPPSGDHPGEILRADCHPPPLAPNALTNETAARLHHRVRAIDHRWWNRRAGSRRIDRSCRLGLGGTNAGPESNSAYAGGSDRRDGPARISRGRRRNGGRRSGDGASAEVSPTKVFLMTLLPKRGHRHPNFQLRHKERG